GPPAFVPFSVNRRLSAWAGAQEDFPGDAGRVEDGSRHGSESLHEEREVRAARNQALFRAVNENLRTLNEAFASVAGTFTIACECADRHCVEMIEIDPKQWLAVPAVRAPCGAVPAPVRP